MFGFRDPTQDFDGMRPGIPNAPVHQDLLDACWRRRHEYDLRGETEVLTLDGMRPAIDWAKADLPQEVVDWGDVFIVHHAEHAFLRPVQFRRLIAAGKRVIWRTVGQSVEGNERRMAPLRRMGLEIVRYSPKEVNIPGYIGSDALIRFYADPDEWGGWTGVTPWVVNVTQHDSTPHGRDAFVNWPFWEAATQGLNRSFAGSNSELVGGEGKLSYEAMKAYLRSARAYLYTGTLPASYTLGLIEALMTGVPVVSIGPTAWRSQPYVPDVFEGHELASRCDDNPDRVRGHLRHLLEYPQLASVVSETQREAAIATFGKATIAKQWLAYLGTP